jgi:fumarylpyruvate hydrolase
MTDYIFSPPERVSLAIAGSEARFPVRRILCVGQNYAAHAREMGADPMPWYRAAVRSPIPA